MSSHHCPLHFLGTPISSTFSSAIPKPKFESSSFNSWPCFATKCFNIMISVTVLWFNLLLLDVATFPDLLNSQKMTSVRASSIYVVIVTHVIVPTSDNKSFLYVTFLCECNSFCNTQNGTVWPRYIHFVGYKSMFANCSRTVRELLEQIYNCSRASRTIVPELELETNTTHSSRTRDEHTLNLVREEIFCSCSCSWFGSHICCSGYISFGGLFWDDDD